MLLKGRKRVFVRMESAESKGRSSNHYDVIGKFFVFPTIGLGILSLICVLCNSF